MQKIQKLYRATYTGEEITSSMTFEGGQWKYEREFVPNSVVNNRLSSQACVIGNGDTRAKFELHLVGNHRGGLLGRDALQSYGCNALYRDFAPNFLVATGKEIVQELAESGYCDEHIVYANSPHIQAYAGKFYLIPQDPAWNSGTLAAYLACFDGHKKIFLIGFDNNIGENFNNNCYAGTNGYDDANYNVTDDYWVNSMAAIMAMYSDVEFYRVMPGKYYKVPDAWAGLLNFHQIDYRQFALAVDL
jgi:hypothetical protein